MDLETKTIDAANNREIRQAFDDLAREFDAFRSANDERLAAMEKRSADVVTDEKVERINQALTEQKRALDERVLAAQRPAIGGEKKSLAPQIRERKAAFDR